MNRKNIWMALFGTVGLFGLNMGFLGVHGGGHADHGRDECSLFGHEAPEESNRRDQKRLTGRQHGQFILCFNRTAISIQKIDSKSSKSHLKSLPRISPKSYRHRLYLKPFLIAIFNFSHKRPTFAFTPESGYTLAFQRKMAHSGLHAETGGVSDGGGITTLGAFRTFTNIPGPGIRTASFAAFGAWSGVLTKDAESLRNSDALMRVAVPRRRGPAGLRSPYCGVLGFPAFA